MLPRPWLSSQRLTDLIACSSEDKKKAKELEKDELRTRHHGPHQFAPFRTGVWAKGGVKKRMRLAQQTITGNKPRHKNVESEA